MDRWIYKVEQIQRDAVTQRKSLAVVAGLDQNPFPAVQHRVSSCDSRWNNCLFCVLGSICRGEASNGGQGIGAHRRRYTHNATIEIGV